VTCLPVPIPLPCIPVPPPPPPIVADKPPVFDGKVKAEVTGRRVMVSWDPAKDEGPVRYRVFRDGRGVRETAGVSVRFWLPCGKHTIRVEAVDVIRQRDSRAVAVTRRCSVP
jgi:hypothetical protein